eukprot:scaffold6852_cov215-Ochromonas_danica.AAC.24
MYRIETNDIVRGYPGCISPLNVVYSPDGKQLNYLYPDAHGVRRIFTVDVVNAGNSSCRPRELFDNKDITCSTLRSLTLEEQLRRERMRLFTDGISFFEWASSLTSEGWMRMIIPTGEKLLLYEQLPHNEASGLLTEIYSGALGTPIDPHISPNGSAVAFVLAGDLYVLPLLADYHSAATAGGVAHPQPIRLTYSGEKEGISCGLAEFIAQEEMDRYQGFWWSPDSLSLLYTIVDERQIPEYCIPHVAADDPHRVEKHRYPFAGKENAKVSLAVVTLDENGNCVGEHRALPLPEDREYLARAGWWPDGSIMVQLEDRKQNYLHLYRIDSLSGVSNLLVEEHSKIWINLHDLLHTFSPSFQRSSDDKKGDFYFLWGSERNGYRHLYLYKYSSADQMALCLSDKPVDGEVPGVVSSINAVDEEKGLVFYSSNAGDSRERHLFVAPLQPKGDDTIVKITTCSGYHSCTVLAERGLIADISSAINYPIKLELLKWTNNELQYLTTILDNTVTDPRLSERPELMEVLHPPIMFSVPTDDDNTPLMCAVYLPPMLPATQVFHETYKGPKWPAIVLVYGGPCVQRVTNQWLMTADQRAQRFAQEGYIVIKCDNRGTANRGMTFEGAIHRCMGSVELVDQETVVRHLAQRGVVDASRVGITGWSYGGYLSAMALCKANDTFCCAVSGAPVTSWDGYDTHYTERYMKLPEEEKESYNESSVLNHVNQMKGHLLIIHGLIDENVHFRHTARLLQALNRAQKPYQVVMLPNERHAPHSYADNVCVEENMRAFFQRHLTPSSSL